MMDLVGVEDGLKDGWLVVDIVDIDGCAVDIEDGDVDDEGGEDLVIVGKDVKSLFMPSPPTTALELSSSSLIINSSTSSINSFISSNIPSIALLLSLVVVVVLLLLV